MIISHESAPNLLHIFNCKIDLEGVGFEPGNTRGKPYPPPSDLFNCNYIRYC